MSISERGKGLGGQGTRYLLQGFIVVGAIFGKPLESILGLFVAALVEF